MMWLFVALLGGLALGARSVLLLPLAYVASWKRRDWGLAIYFVFGVLALNEVRIGDVLSYAAVKAVFFLILPSFMALREMMSLTFLPSLPKDYREIRPEGAIPAALVLLGIVYWPLFIAGVLLLLVPGSDVRGLASSRLPLAAVVLPILALAALRVLRNELYTPETQVALLAAFSIFALLWRWRERKRVDFRLYGDSM
ncbi:hypothetical protein APY94_02100 [Thermococcus celericrescens]|uniref:Uncharacterized protein n=1 Tax=Thermococcus celericrescens TaxID=227598 RepID=A0A100XZG1_9EURY|nr:hypothetical protein [Thermococcus celericrescens]KUH34448.1 hypothetical protein APY94_02100 [Thermococcus celericrescens]